MQLPFTIKNLLDKTRRIRKWIRNRRKWLYRKAWLMRPFKFLWVNLLVVKRIVTFPFRDYKKLKPFSRITGVLSTFFLVLFLLLFIKISTTSDKVIYSKKVYATFDCGVSASHEKRVEVGTVHRTTYELPCYEDVPIVIMYTSGYGVFLREETVQDGKISYQTPNAITEKIGEYEINLLYGERNIFKDDLTVHTNPNNIDYIESYFGPRIILAGGVDYSMLTVVPVDEFDNPMPDDTRINVHENFRELQQLHQQFTSDFVSYRRFYSYNETGKITVSMNSDNGITTKEKTSDVYPYTPKDFTIQQSKEHNFADGNEVVSLRTSIIEDIFGNIIQNGTMVHFQIRTNTGKQLASYAKIVKGIATTKIQHPYKKESWSVQAFIPGLAQSNTIELDFEQIASDFPVAFLNENRKIQIGPVKSYMGQLIPNGTAVSLTISSKDKEQKVTQYTVGGLTTFILRDFYHPEGDYEFTLETIGLTKHFEKYLSDEKK